MFCTYNVIPTDWLVHTPHPSLKLTPTFIFLVLISCLCELAGAEELVWCSFFVFCVLQDFKEQVIHHVATIVLIGFSWLVNYIRAGTLIMLVHDASDYLMEVWTDFWSRCLTEHFVLSSEAWTWRTTLPPRGQIVSPFFCFSRQKCSTTQVGGKRATSSSLRLLQSSLSRALSSSPSGMFSMQLLHFKCHSVPWI